MKKTVSLIQDGEDLILPLDDEIFGSLGWKVGDTIKWTDNGDGSWAISRVESILSVAEQSLVCRLRKAAEIALEAMKYADACLKKQLTTKTKYEYAQDLLIDATTALQEAMSEQPAQRTWVGLTGEEFIELCDKDLGTAGLIKAVEDKLKEKNT